MGIFTFATKIAVVFWETIPTKPCHGPCEPKSPYLDRAIPGFVDEIFQTWLVKKSQSPLKSCLQLLVRTTYHFPN
jgi:hypothetical protein